MALLATLLHKILLRITLLQTRPFSYAKTSLYLYTSTLQWVHVCLLCSYNSLYILSSRACSQRESSVQIRVLFEILKFTTGSTYRDISYFAANGQLQICRRTGIIYQCFEPDSVDVFILDIQFIIETVAYFLHYSEQLFKKL